MIPPDCQVMNRVEVMTAVGAGSVATFQRWRRNGKLPGFPPPASPQGWDPKAVRAWLDSRMPDHLRAAAGITPAPANDPGADPELARRSRELAGGA